MCIRDRKDTLLKRVIRKMLKIISGERVTKINYFYFLDAFLLNRKIKKAMKSLKGGCNIYFAPVASELIASGGIPDDCKLIYLSDATVHLLMNYYYDLSTHDYFIWNSWEQKAIDRANTILYSSDWAKNDAISYYKADREKVFVAPFGANLSDQYKGKIRMPGLIRLLLVLSLIHIFYIDFIFQKCFWT